MMKERLGSEKMRGMGLSQTVMDQVKTEVSQEMQKLKDDTRFKVKLPTQRDLKLVDGCITFNAQYLTLKQVRTVRVQLTKVDHYLTHVRQNAHLRNKMQTEQDIFSLMAKKIKEHLCLARAPIHFFTLDGKPLLNFDQLLKHIADEPNGEPWNASVYCQVRIQFRSDYHSTAPAAIPSVGSASRLSKEGSAS